jgi:hypothetical protein
MYFRGSIKVSILRDTADTMICAPDDEWRYHPKHEEQFTNTNKLYIVTSFWKIIDIYFTRHGPSNVKHILHHSVLEMAIRSETGNINSG